MKLLRGLRRRPVLAIATVLAFFCFSRISRSVLTRLPAKASAEDKQDLQDQLRKGIGSEVRIAARPEQADDQLLNSSPG